MYAGVFSDAVLFRSYDSLRDHAQDGAVSDGLSASHTRNQVDEGCFLE